MSAKLTTSVLVALLAACGSAQTTTSCNPMEKSCPSDTALGSSYYSHDFTQGPDDSNWKMTADGITYTDAGAVFTINKAGDSPTLQSNFYLFFGSVSWHVRSAPGTGIVSSAILQSDDLDEVDWEWLGGIPNVVQTNYFGKGNTTSYDREVDVAAANAQTTTHNYTISWTSSAITWLVDSVPLRTLNYADAVGGANFPQTPMDVRIGIWAGGAAGNPQGTIEWAGGNTDFSQAPFSMVLEKIEVVNANPGKSYSYGDKSGSWQSIQIDGSSGQTSNGNDDAVSQSSSKNSADSASSTIAASSSTMVTATASATPSSDAKADGENQPTATSASSPSQSKAAGDSQNQTTQNRTNAGGKSAEMGVLSVLTCAALIFQYLV